MPFVSYDGLQKFQGRKASTVDFHSTQNLEILAPEGHHFGLSLSSERQNFWHKIISQTLSQHHSKEKGTQPTPSPILLEDIVKI